MVMAAKFPGVCKICRRGIKVGERIEWSKVDGARHAACVDPAGETKRVETLAASRATSAEINVPAPEGLDYLPFQKAGIQYALNRPATLIADEMGLGKTLEAIGVVNSDPSIKSVLVICPASLRLNWKRELEKWLTRPMSIEIANGIFPDGADVVVINFDILKKHTDILRATKWDLLVVDECHFCKNPKTIRTRQVVGGKDITPIPATRRLFLTGTPIVNRPIELWPIVHFLAPQVFGNFMYFAKRYCDAVHNGYGWDFTGANNLPELQDKLRASIMVRRLKSEVLKELPPKRRQVIELPANGAGKAIAAEASAWSRHEAGLEALQARVELAKASEDPQDYADAVSALREGAQAAFTEISKLRHETAVAKIPAVIEHLREVLETGNKVVVFAHHHDVIDALAAEFGVTAVTLTGETPMQARQAAVDRFQTDPSCQVFLGSITAAGVGITLTASSHVVFAELDWVPGNVTQAEDRTHRIGQVNPVLVQHLVLDGSLDARMAHILVEKQAVLDAALDQVAAATMPDEPAIPTARNSGSGARRDQIAAEAEKLTPEQIAAVHTGLRRLAGMDEDRASDKNDMGYNRLDGTIGHDLASRSKLTPKQAALGRQILRKYHWQLGPDLLQQMGA